MTWEQLREWREYAQLEPFGAERERLRVRASCAATIANSPHRRQGVPGACQAGRLHARFDSATRPAQKPMNEGRVPCRAFDQFKEAVKATAGA